jgi:electron transfer flavoprotein beta subunit
MRIAVCVKQIPKEHERIVFDPESLRVRRDGKLIMDDSDAYGVELALRLVGEAGEGEVIVVSMAPHDEETGLRHALAMGAARAVLVSDDALGGSDALRTATVLAAVVARIKPDIVIAGTESTDGYTGTMPIQLSELLGWPSLAFSSSLDLVADDGVFELSCPLPAIATVTSGSVEPRYPSLRGIMEARRKPIETLRLSDLALNAAEFEADGASEEVRSIVPAQQRAAGEVIVDDGTAEVRVLSLLSEWKAI